MKIVDGLAGYVDHWLADRVDVWTDGWRGEGDSDGWGLDEQAAGWFDEK